MHAGALVYAPGLQRRNQKIFEGGAKRLSQHMAMAAAGGVTATYVRLQFG